jgi:hypothetical protein
VRLGPVEEEAEVALADVVGAGAGTDADNALVVATLLVAVAPLPCKEK